MLPPRLLSSAATSSCPLKTAAASLAPLLLPPASVLKREAARSLMDLPPDSTSFQRATLSSLTGSAGAAAAAFSYNTSAADDDVDGVMKARA